MIDISIPIPRHLESRPRYKGMAIPYIAVVQSDGTPDFRVTDVNKRGEVMLEQLCQLCGNKLGRFMFFIGGPISAAQMLYYEPATHLDCMLYAMQVCPFIMGRMEHAPVEKIKKQYAERGKTERNPLLIHTDPNYTTIRTPFWVIIKAGGYRFASLSETIMLVPDPVFLTTKQIRPDTMTPADWRDVREELVS